MRHALFLLLFLVCATVLWAELRPPGNTASSFSACFTGSGDHTLHASERLHVSTRAAAPDDAAQKEMLFEAWESWADQPTRWRVPVEEWPGLVAGRHAGHLYAGWVSAEGTTRLEEWTIAAPVGQRWTRCPRVEIGESPRVREFRVRRSRGGGAPAGDPVTTRGHLATLPLRVDHFCADLGGRYLLLLAEGRLSVLDLDTLTLRSVPLQRELRPVVAAARGVYRSTQDPHTFVLYGGAYELHLQDRAGDGDFERVRVIDPCRSPSLIEQLLAWR